MKIALVAVALAFAGAVAHAEEERTDPDAIARAKLMATVGMNTKVLGDMASGKTGFDAAAAADAKAALSGAAGEIAAVFQNQGGEDPADEAKPEIWTNWDDFISKATALKTAVDGADVASLEGVKAGMSGIGGACKDCHTTYRE